MPPESFQAGMLTHPGDQYQYCQDSNRYVRGFDHSCDFVGNDIGTGNMAYFVLFLLAIASLAGFLVVRCRPATPGCGAAPTTHHHQRPLCGLSHAGVQRHLHCGHVDRASSGAARAAGSVAVCACLQRTANARPACPVVARAAV